MTGFAERRWRSPDGLRLHARDYAGADGGARLPVVCLHGLTRNARDFEEVAPWIAAQGRRVLVPDARGRGLSEWDGNASRYQPRTYVRDLIALLDQLGIARAIFVGTSMGGIMTMLLAGARPKMVAGAVLNDVGPEVAPEGIARIMSYVGQGAPVRNWDEAADYSQRINEVAFPDHQASDWQAFARRTFCEDEGALRFDYDPAIMEPLLQGRYKAPAWLAWRLFRKLTRRAPTMIVRGGLSDLLSPGIARRMQREGRGVRLVEVPGVGHAPMLTEPVAQAAVAEFLATLP